MEEKALNHLKMYFLKLSMKFTTEKDKKVSDVKVFANIFKNISTLFQKTSQKITDKALKDHLIKITNLLVPTKGKLTKTDYTMNFTKFVNKFNLIMQYYSASFRMNVR